MDKTIPEGYLRDPRGALIPIDTIKEVDILRNDLVLEIVAKAQQFSQVLAEFKTTTMDDIAAFIELSGEKYGVKIGGEKGNVTLTSFDGEFKVVRAISEHITFDERLQAAKALIDQCISSWTVDSRSEIRVLVNYAFEVDKQGKINTNRILSLRRLDIEDPRWMEAMAAISDSVQVCGSKAYIRIYRRHEDGSYRQINLDVAAV